MSQPDPSGRARRPRFRETALASGLLEEAQITAAEREIEATMPGVMADADARDKAIADALVARGLLTPFQTREMLAGRRRFRLGQYTVLDEVGKGGMGRVFRAEHAMMGREVAVKVLPREKSTPDSEAAFRREMRMLGRLDHENLVRAFDAGFDAQVYYLVTELVPGVDLKRYVRERGPLDETSAAVVIAQAARGLAYAHEQGLVHRDVKPGNILVLRDMRVKVLDLGLAESSVEAESSRVGRIIGTMDYIAPEQISEPDGAEPVVDVYSLGCTLYYAVTGQVPFPGGSRREKLQKHLHERPQPVKELAPHLSEAFCRVIEDMMAKSPTERIGSAGEVIERLQPWLAEGRRRPRVTDPKVAASPLPGDGEAIAPLTLPSDESSSFWDNLVPPTPASSRSLLADMLPARAATRRLLRSAGWAILFAAGVGLPFGFAMAVLRRVDAPRFHHLVFGMSPLLLGCLAFLLIFVLQMLVVLGGRR